MISNHYEKPSLESVDFSLEEVVTTSAPVVTTTTAPTTLPGTTQSGVQIGGNGGGQDITIPYSDLFHD
jgi:hypothetical protein